METIGQRIRTIRKYYKLNQTDFGKAIGISYGHVSNIEKDKDVPSDMIIKLIAYEYNTSEEWILNGTGDMITHKIAENYNNFEDSKTLLILLDDILAGSPSSLRKKQETVLENIVLLLKFNMSLNQNMQAKNLECLNRILSDLFNFVSAVTSFENTNIFEGCTKIIEETKLEKLLDDLQDNLSSNLEDFKDSIIDTTKLP